MTSKCLLNSNNQLQAAILSKTPSFEIRLQKSRIASLPGAGGSIWASANSESDQDRVQTCLSTRFGILGLHTVFLESFAHFSNILPSWGPFCPGSSSFCPLSTSGQEKGCFGVGLGVFCVCTYPQKGFVTGESRTGVARLVVVVWAKWDPNWAKWDPSGQFVRKVGKSALEID